MTIRRPRGQVLFELRAMRGDLLTAIERWRVGRFITVPRDSAAPADLLDELPHVGVHASIPDDQLLRFRRPWEYPEWRSADWLVLAREMAHLVKQADELRQYAIDQAEALLCTGCHRSLPPTEARAGYKTCEHCPTPTPTTSTTRED